MHKCVFAAHVSSLNQTLIDIISTRLKKHIWNTMFSNRLEARNLSVTCSMPQCMGKPRNENVTGKKPMLVSLVSTVDPDQLYNKT